MNFPVPWRCLIPSEAVDFLAYNNGAILQDLAHQSGAMIHISSEQDTPKRLSDRILTISGQADQKEAACKGVVLRLRTLQDLQDPRELGFFVIVVPATSVPVIVGAKGATINEVLAGTGAELSIGRENVMGMPDTPIGFEGTALQIVAAAANLHKVIQDMADRGRLQPSDFKYRPDKAAAMIAQGAGGGLHEVVLPSAEHDLYGGLDPTQNFRTKAKLVVDTQTAGWLIGKAGRHIREMQENSGAFLHVLREDEAPPLLQAGDRLIEICGRYERKLEGLQVVMRTADSMPNSTNNNVNRIIVPRVLAEPQVMDAVSAHAGVAVELVAGVRSTEDECLIQIAGPISGRVQAAQDFLTRTDRAHMDGTVVAKSVDGEMVGATGRPRKEIREAMPEGSWLPQAPAPEPNPQDMLLRQSQENLMWRQATREKSRKEEWAQQDKERKHMRGEHSVVAVEEAAPPAQESFAVAAQPPDVAQMVIQPPHIMRKEQNAPGDSYWEEQARKDREQRSQVKPAIRFDLGGDQRREQGAGTADRDMSENDRGQQDRREQERREQARRETERRDQERSDQERREMERKDQERRETDRIETDRRETRRSDDERKEAQRREDERRERERRDHERTELERREEERKELERIRRLQQDSHPGVTGRSDQVNGFHSRNPEAGETERHQRLVDSCSSAPHNNNMEGAAPGLLAPSESSRTWPRNAARREEEPHRPSAAAEPPCPESHSSAAFESRLALQAKDEERRHEEMRQRAFSAEAAAAAAPQVEAMLLGSSMMGNTRSRLEILISSRLLLQSLVPSGHLQDVAKRCQVHIEIADELESPPGTRCVVLVGTVAGNAAAAYWLQVGAVRWGDAC